MQEFITVRENVERSRRAEIKRQQQHQQQLQQQQQQQLQQQSSQNDNSGKSITAKTSRRHTSLVSATTVTTTTALATNVPEKSESFSKQQTVTVNKADTPTKRETEEKPKPAADRASLLQDIMKKPNSRRKSAIL